MAFFYEEGEEKKRSGVFMRHVNIGTIAEDEDGNGSYAPSRIFIDPTLTQEGEAAEAKATGDAINALAEQTNQDLDELSEKTETAISDLQDATEEAINSLAAIGVIEDTKSGEVVSISDSAAYKMQGLRLYGKSRQATTTGAQLLDIREEIASSGTSITATTDGTGGVTINGTAGSGGLADIYLVGSWDSSEVLFEEDTYTFSVDGLSADENLYVINNQSIVKQSIGTGNCTVTSQITGLSIRLKAEKTYSNIKIYPMLSASSSAKPWEPYTGGKPSPSPEYPQEIESAGDGGDIATQIMGANLFDASKNILPKPVTFSISIEGENTFTVTALKEGTGLEFYIRVPIDVPVGTTASISGQSSDGYQFNLLNRQIDGSLAVGELTGKTMARKEGLRLFAVCNPFGGSTINVSEGQTVTCTDVTVSIGSTALPWEPYKSQTLTYPTPNGLPGIPVESGGNYTDAEGQQWICDEVDFGRGKYVQRIKKEFLTGTPNFNVPDAVDAERFRWDSCLTNIYKDGSNLSLSNFATFKYWSTGTSNPPIFAVSGKGVFFKPTASTTAEEVNALFTQMIASENPPYIVGQLETPIETDLTPEQLAAYAALTTYKPNTTITTDSDPAAGIGVDYIADTKAYIDNKFAQLTELSTVVNALIGADE